MRSAAFLFVVSVAGVARVAQPGDPVRDAQTLIMQGHPWRATQVIAPVLREPRTRTPAALITAARAAAGWGGWTEIDRLLGREPWIDSLFGGEGRELLTWSSLATGGDTGAVTLARAALAAAQTPAARATRTVLLARAYERSNMFDSAAAAYTRAKDAFPSIRDWLTLRAAGSESDSVARAREYASITSTVAKPRRLWTEAQARERFSDALGSATRYASLGAPVIALRLRLSVAPDSSTRDTIANELLAFIASHKNTADARAAVDVLDKGFTSLSPDAELTIARGIATSGAPARAVAAFQHALAKPALVTPADRLLYAQALTRAGRSRDAIAQLDDVTGPLAGQAGYQRARVLLTSGTADAVRSALRAVVAQFPNDTAAASSALYLLGDLSTDDGNDTQARALFRQLYSTYPTSTQTARARFNAAMLALVSGSAKPAAAEFDSLLTLMPRSDEAIAARYWSGRARTQSGDQTGARARWREVIAQQPASYYAVLSAKRLGESPWVPTARADSFPSASDADSALARIDVLDRLGLDVESRVEYDALEAAAMTPERLLATAHALSRHGQASRAMRLAQKLADAGQRDARTFRLLYPVVDRDELMRDARARNLDPALVAGLIRQESGFNPRAVSVANARGLMQILPSVGEEISHSLGFPLWNVALLFDADANLQLGTSHLASFIQQYGTIPRVLAAYNAGGSRVSRWSSKAGVDDAEIFAERVPFIETRDYVRIVQRNAAIYRGLYDW